jgi:hypothetical protein
MCKTPNKKITTKSQDLKNYYFPVDSLVTTKVYHYKPDNSKEPHLYWELTAIKNNGKTILTTESYSIDHLDSIRLVEFIIEEITELGANIIGYTEFQYDSKGKQYAVNATIENNEAFKWTFTQNEGIHWNFTAQSKIQTGYSISTSKRRSWLNQTEEVTFNNQKINAEIFSDTFEIIYSNKQLNDNQSFKFSQVSLYAENIGMFRYTRKFQSNKQITYTLVEMLSKEEWELKKNN